MATVVLAVAAYLGVNAWRKQLHGHTDYQLARQIIKTVLQWRDRMQYGVRNPFMWPAEYADRPERNPDARGTDADDTAWAYQKRWNRAEEAYRELDVLLLEAEAVWDDALADARKKLDKCRTDLMLALQDYLAGKRDRHAAGGVITASIEEYSRNQDMVFGGGKDDPYQKELNAAVDAFKEWCKKYLK